MQNQPLSLTALGALATAVAAAQGYVAIRWWQDPGDARCLFISVKPLHPCTRPVCRLLQVIIPDDILNLRK